MGLTTSCEVIERHANPAPNEPDPGESEPSYVGKTLGQYFHNTATRPPPVNTKRSLEDYELPKKKQKKRDQHQATKRPGSKASPKASSAAGRGQGGGLKSGSKRATPKSATSKNVRKAQAAAVDSKGTDQAAGEEEPAAAAPAPPRPPTVNPHRARIAIGKQALAAIKEGTRIYIKSGEGNGGDTWWDSGVIRKIHERGKRFEVEWQGINNRGEEVDTNVEKRIDLPVTYSLAGAAADAIAQASPGSHGASLARKGVLAAARIGSWCIQYPEESWGMLDPFGEDSSVST